MVTNIILILAGILIGSLICMFYPKLKRNSYEKKKSIVDLQIEVYKREEELRVDRDIESRKRENWRQVDDARVSNEKERSKLKDLKSELECEIFAKRQEKESLDESIKQIKFELGEYKKAINLVVIEKDKEVQRLNETLNKMIDKVGTQVRK